MMSYCRLLKLDQVYCHDQVPLEDLQVCPTVHLTQSLDVLHLSGDMSSFRFRFIRSLVIIFGLCVRDWCNNPVFWPDDCSTCFYQDHGPLSPILHQEGVLNPVSR